MKIVPTRQINVKNVNLNKLPRNENVEVKKCRPIFPLLMPIDLFQNSYDELVESALQKGNGDILLDPIFKRNNFLFAICLSVRGTVVNTRGEK